MAIAQGTKSENVGNGFKLYTGIGEFHVVGVNPTKVELEKIWGRELNKEMEYLTANEAGVKKFEVKFIIKQVQWSTFHT